MQKRFFTWPAVLALGLSLSVSCSDSTEEENANNDSSAIDVNDEVVSAENVFVYVPSPIETASLLRSAGARYNKDLLNLPQNSSRYSTTGTQALNLGIYGTDLAFAGIFDQHAETMVYLDCTGKLADALHVSSAFNTERHQRLESNINNRDSVLSIITDTYWDCDALLHENKQQYASALMIAGGWIEGLYLACKVAEETNNNDIRIRIVEQRSSLDKLLLLLDKQDNADVKAISAELKDLKKLFDALPQPTPKPTVVSTDTTNNITVIGEDAAPAPVSLNALEFKGILDQVTKIRTNIINRS